MFVYKPLRLFFEVLRKAIKIKKNVTILLLMEQQHLEEWRMHKDTIAKEISATTKVCATRLCVALHSTY